MTGEPYVVRLVFGLRRPRHGIPFYYALTIGVEVLILAFIL
jgi:hypothetical protein